MIGDAKRRQVPQTSEASRQPPAEARRGTRIHKMNTNERLLKLATASPAVLAKIDHILDGTDGKPGKADDDCRLVTYTEAAKRLNISRPTVYRLAKAGRLEIVPLDGVKRCKKPSRFRRRTTKQKCVTPLILLGETHFWDGGEEEIRTPDPHVANVMHKHDYS